MSNTILTSTGRYFDFEHPWHHEFCIEDIAHALSHLCRFTGHVSSFYSVAQHSVLVSKFCPPELALVGLLHDAAEAYLGDVSSPLKRMLPDYKAIEHSVEVAIANWFGIDFPHDPRVKEVDLRMLMTEKTWLMPTTSEDSQHWANIEPYVGIVTPLQPVAAKQQFMTRYLELQGML